MFTKLQITGFFFACKKPHLPHAVHTLVQYNEALDQHTTAVLIGAQHDYHDYCVYVIQAYILELLEIMSLLS